MSLLVLWMNPRYYNSLCILTLYSLVKMTVCFVFRLTFVTLLLGAPYSVWYLFAALSVMSNILCDICSSTSAIITSYTPGCGIYIYIWLVVQNLVNTKNIKNGYNLEEEEVTYALLKDDDDGL